MDTQLQTTARSNRGVHYVRPLPQQPKQSRRYEVDFAEAWRIIRKRKLVTLICLAVAVGGAILLVLVLPTRYEAMARIDVDLTSMMPSLDETASQTVQGSSEDPSTRLTSQVEILNTDTVAWDTIKKLRMDHRVSFTGKKLLAGPNTDLDHADPLYRMRLLNMFHKRFNVRLLPKTEIIELRFRDRDPQLAADVVNTLSEDYINLSLRHRYKATMQASDWLSSQLDDLKKSMEAAQRKYADYQKEKGIILTNGANETGIPGSAGTQSNIVLDKVQELNHDLTLAEADRVTKEARLRVMQTGDPELITSLSSGQGGVNATLAGLRGHEAELRSALAKESAIYGDTYPSVIQLKGQLRDLRMAIQGEMGRLLKTAQNDYQQALKSEQMMSSALQSEKKEAYKMNDDAVRLEILRRDAAASRDTYDEVLKRLKVAGVVAGLRATNLTVVDPAAIPAVPAEPKSEMIIALSLAGGLLFGLGLAFGVEALDSTVRTPDDVENLCAMPSLGMIPVVSGGVRLPGARANPPVPVMLSQPNSQAGEAFRCLRTALLLAAPAVPPNIIVVTSGLPKEGKTTTSVNMALVMAQKGSRILLVDADLRRPTVHTKLGLKQTNSGFSAVLAGHDFRDALLHIDAMPSLDILPAGSRPPNPAELIDSTRMRELLSAWREQYDHVIIDCAPVLGMTDSVVLATMADAVVLICRSGQTRYQSLRRTRDLLGSVHARVVGVVVNGLDTNSESHYNYYGYYGKSYDGYYLEGKKGARA